VCSSDLVRPWMMPPEKSPADEPASAAGPLLPVVEARPPDGGAPHPQSSSHRPWLSGLLLIAATFLAYQSIWHAGFIWDDDFYVTANATLHDLAGLRQIWFKIGAVPQYYPLTHTTFWLEYHLWGLHPLGYHLDNVLLHALAAVLLGCVLGRLQVPGAWLAAAIFALHPVQAESVAWVTERKNVLSVLFYFAAALAWLHFDPPGEADVSRRRRWHFYFAALVLFIAALLSKTVTCSLPAALLLVRWWKNNRLRAGDLLPLLPFFVMGGGLGWLTAWVEKYHVGARGAEWSLTFADRCLVAGRASWFYAGKLAWPAQLTFIYPRWQINAGLWWQWVFPLAAAGVVAALWFLRGRIGRGPLVGVLFFAGTLGPALGFVNTFPMRYSFVADHFQYLASLGLIALAAVVITVAFGSFRGKKPFGEPVFCGILLVVLGGLTWRQCGMYADPETLWRTTIARNPNCWMAQVSLGTMLLDQGKPVEAETLYRAALQHRPDDAEVHYDLGLALATQGKLDEAIRQYERALQLKPDDTGTHNNLGLVLAAQGKLDEAIQHYERVLQITPDDAEALDNLGGALAAEGKLDEAIQCYERSLQLKPGYTETRYNLGVALAAQGKWDKAIEYYESALKLKPDQAETHGNLGYALGAQGKWAEAVQHYERALQLKPDQAETHFYLGVALAKQMKWAEAIQNYEQALQIKPDYTEAHVYLGAVLATQGKLAEAIQHYERALQIKPDDAEAHNNLGVALAKQMKWAEAIQNFERALQIKPDYAEARNNLGIVLAAQEKSAETIPHSRKP
jgi:protein O-mannosyl-transferase